MIQKLYAKVVFGYPKLLLTLLVLMVGFLANQATELKVDASSKTLLLEDDKDLAYTRLVHERYDSSDFLVITYKPKKDLLDRETLNNIKNLSDEIEKLPQIKSINSIRNIPLLQSSSLPIAELTDGVPSLATHKLDKSLVKKELLNNPLYIENFVSPDFRTTAIIINLHDNDSKDIRHTNIINIRQIMQKYKSDAEMFLGGANMIADDMITFVKNDLKTYGVIVLLLLIAILYIVFGELKWVLIPVVILSSSIISSIGLLGLFGWEVTVVSSNFISFLLILTTSIIIHLIVKYRELSQREYKEHKDLILDTVVSMSKPTFFAVITTIAGFSSLVLSGILPVMNLGWMMSAGLLLSFVITYLLFGVIMFFTKASKPNKSFEKKFTLTSTLSNIVTNRASLVFIFAAFVLLFSISGATKLRVENSFINYFKSDTEIYQGMLTIDEELGGTTPLDITIDLETEQVEVLETQNLASANEDEFLDEFEDEFEEDAQKNQYWFTPTKMQKIEKIHAYLESIPELGKVLSFASVLRLGKSINDNKDLDNFQLALLYNELPSEIKKLILEPYISIEDNQVRFTIRLVDSNQELRRNELIEKIRRDIHEKFSIDKEKIHLSGIVVLYNNMIQSLYESQILTLGAMVFLLFSMFWFLFKSFKI
ncbi:MAG: MMPL family transporter, partial [Campylobacterota bacterium]|nr:MMPL family transporter [Campylobacterota bacterium]